MKQYEGEFSDEECLDYENLYKIWLVIVKVLLQQVIVNSDVIIEMSKDKVGLWNIFVKIKKVGSGFIFDMGVNISMVLFFIVREFGMIVFDVNIDVCFIIGDVVKVDLGVCEEFLIGYFKLCNVLFLVFLDDVFIIVLIDYCIKGIFGFLVIEVLGEIIVFWEGILKIVQYLIQYFEFNFVFDFFIFIVEIDCQYFVFDSGVIFILFYLKWYWVYEVEI